MGFSWIDLIVLGVIGIFVVRNTWIGFLRGLASLLGIAAGVIVAGRYHPLIQKIVSPWLKANWISPLSYIITFLLAFLVVFITVELVRKLVHAVRLSWMDRLLGFFLGLAKGILLIALAFMLMATFFPKSKSLFKESFTYPYIVSGARFLVELCPESWRARFNYNLKHYFGHGKHQKGPRKR